MRRTIAIVSAIVLLAGNQLGGQPVKSSGAKVTLAGHATTSVSSNQNGKVDRYVVLNIDGMTTVKVETDQDLAKFVEQRFAQQQKMFEDFAAQTEKLFANGDTAALEKAQKEFATASAELKEYGKYYAADGNLKVLNGELRLVGHLRPLVPKGADKDLGKGKAAVEGEAIYTKFDAGNGPKMTLAIQNGKSAIAVTGKAAEDLANVKGTIRVVGVLRLTKSGPLVEAEKIEVLKK